MDAQEKGVELVAPTQKSALKVNRYHLDDFSFDSHGKITVCPQGESPLSHQEKEGHHTLRFDAQKCQSCPFFEPCPVKAGKSNYSLSFNDKQKRLALRRNKEKQPEFAEQYRFRSGVEATMSEYKTLTGVKRLRVRGLKAVRFSATLKAIGVNIFRATNVRKARNRPLMLNFLRKCTKLALYFNFSPILCKNLHKVEAI